MAISGTSTSVLYDINPDNFWLYPLNFSLYIDLMAGTSNKSVPEIATEEIHQHSRPAFSRYARALPSAGGPASWANPLVVASRHWIKPENHHRLLKNTQASCIFRVKSWEHGHLLLYIYIYRYDYYIYIYIYEMPAVRALQNSSWNW